MRGDLTCAVAATMAGLAAMASAAPSAYQTAVLANSPAVFYRFNEANIVAGTSTAPASTATDYSGNGFLGNYVSNATPTPSNPVRVAGAGIGSDNAVSFDGTSQYVQVTDKALGNSMLNASYEFVFKANAGITTGQPVLYGEANGTGTQQVQANYIVLNSNAAGTTTANSVRFYIRTTANSAGFLNQFAFSAPTLYDGNYHDLVITYNNGTAGVAGSATFNAYIDGASVSSQTGTGMNGAVTNFDYYPALAGNDFRSNNGGSYAPVTFDEAAIYSSVLSASDVLLHAQAAGVPEPTAMSLLGLTAIVGLKRRRA